LAKGDLSSQKRIDRADTSRASESQGEMGGKLSEMKKRDRGEENSEAIRGVGGRAFLPFATKKTLGKKEAKWLKSCIQKKGRTEDERGRLGENVGKDMSS